MAHKVIRVWKRRANQSERLYRKYSKMVLGPDTYRWRFDEYGRYTALPPIIHKGKAYRD